MELIVDNKIIKEPILNILFQLRKELTNGKIKDIVDKQDNIQCTCPIHKNGQERHPSCQIYCGSDKNLYGKVHCFTCGYVADFIKFISDCFDSNDKNFGKEWLIERFGSYILNDTLELAPIVINESKSKYLDESILQRYNYYHPYMEKRHLTKDVITKFKVGFDKDTNCITFPVYDEHNNLVMITKRSVVDKHFYIPAHVNKPIYLLYDLLNTNETCAYITESQINALTLQGWGYPAVALFGTGTRYQYDILKKSGIRDFILCFDGDDAGDKGIVRFYKNMPKDCLISYKKIPRGKDINDLTLDEFNKLDTVY